MGLGGAIIGTIIVVIFMVVLAGILPPQQQQHAYNQQIVTERKVNSYCADLKKDIDSSMQNTQLQNITIEMITDYSNVCSSSSSSSH